MDSSPTKRLTQDLLDTIAQTSRSSARQRQNYDFHQLEERVQRFLNVMQPGTYVRPHRHLRPTGVNGFEFFLVLQGTIGVLILNDRGQVLQTEQISAKGAVRGLELAEGTYHTLISLETDSTVLEIKEGPYCAETDKEFLPDFPLEGTPEAAQWVRTWQEHFGTHRLKTN